jgi:hypothetical protein
MILRQIIVAILCPFAFVGWLNDQRVARYVRQRQRQEWGNNERS